MAKGNGVVKLRSNILAERTAPDEAQDERIAMGMAFLPEECGRMNSGEESEDDDENNNHDDVFGSTDILNDPGWLS